MPSLKLSDDQYTAAKLRFFDISADIMCITSLEGNFYAINAAWTARLGWTEQDLLDKPFLALTHPDDIGTTLAEVSKLGGGQSSLSFVNRYQSRDGTYRWLSWLCRAESQADFVFSIARDVSESQELIAELKSKNAALELARERDRSQRQLIRSLSAPILQVWRGVVVLPLIGTLDEERITSVTDRLLHEIAERSVRFAIIDITGVPVADRTSAALLIRIAQTARLMGARSILTGANPEVAVTLSEFDLPGITPAQTLEEGLKIALQSLGAK